MPLPLNQKTNRLSMACSSPMGEASAAYAVPAALNMETSGGKPTQMGAPERDNPLSNARREILKRLAITCGMNVPSRSREFSRPDQRSHKFPELKLRIPEIFGHLGDQRPVGRRIHPARYVAE